MNTVTTIRELRKKRDCLPEPVGLVPTMGYLHEGHLSLVRAAQAECASVVVSIFVNPTQFGPHEDLDSYPRDLDRDLNLLNAEQVDLVWMPSPATMYPPGYQTWVDVRETTKVLEGSMRPGHFEGVTTVVAKLFNAVQPQKAYFGQKDAQQVIVIQQMVHDLNFNLEVVVCPIVREADGLAMSSRNTNLDPSERRAAVVLSRSLTAARNAYISGERYAEEIRAVMSQILENERLAEHQYISCANSKTLEEIEGQISGQALLSMAVYIGKTRLIDNIIIGE